MASQSPSTGRPSSPIAVMIVGGGPAGISTWLHLQKHAPELAERSLVIDKARFPRDKLCGGGLGSWTPTVLKHLAVELDIPSLVVSDVEIRFGEDYNIRKSKDDKKSAKMQEKLNRMLIKRDIEREKEPTSIKNWFIIASIVLLLLQLYLRYGRKRIIQ